jgi:hypothetical protein
MLKPTHKHLSSRGIKSPTHNPNKKKIKNHQPILETLEILYLLLLSFLVAVAVQFN